MAATVRNKVPKRLVPVFWRAAAVVLAFFLFGGLFASVYTYMGQKHKINELTNKNHQLIQQLDSLKQVSPTVVTEVKYLDKEHIIYVKQPETKAGIATNAEKTGDKELSGLKDEIKAIEKAHQQEIDKLKHQLADYESELLAQKSRQENDSANTRPYFQLKPSGVKEEMQNPIKISSPKMELKLFNNSMEDRNIDSNISLMKK